MLDNEAPQPSSQRPAVGKAAEPRKDSDSMLDPKNPSAVVVTLAGCGGCGINLTRPFLESPVLKRTIFFDTSMTNTRHGEKVNILATGSGSGSNRAENARDIEASIPQMTDESIGLGDVAVVVFSLGGGTGSVLGPLLIREYVRRKVRVIGVAVSDTSSSVGAKNNLNTLKTLTSICKNNDIYLPLILLSNDKVANRNTVNESATQLIANLIDLLTKGVYEVDRNDRLNWINPLKVVSSAQPGLKLLSFVSERRTINPDIVLGTDSKEMVDSLLILQSHDETGDMGGSILPARLKKTGFYYEAAPWIMGRISSDISPIENIIDHVERMEHQDRSQKHSAVDRLSGSNEDDLVL